MIREKINLGCGKDIRRGYINLDMLSLNGVDIVHNLEELPLPFEDDTFNEVLLDNVLEHISNACDLMKDIHRISKNKAIVKIIVPFYNSPYVVGSIEHKHSFEYDSWKNFTSKTSFAWSKEYDFKLKNMKIIPTRLGRLIPFKTLLKYLSYSIGNLVKEVYWELTVIKDTKNRKINHIN